MKEVLFICATGVMGGAEVYLTRLMPALQRSGRPCRAVVPRGTGLARRLQQLDMKQLAWPVHIEPLVARRTGGGVVGRLAGRAGGMLAAPMARRWVASLQAGNRAIVHLNTTRAAFVAGRRTATVVEVKDVLAPPFFQMPLARLVAKRLEVAAQVAIANSGFIAQHLVAAGYPSDRVTTIINGLDLDTIRPLDDAEREQVRRHEGWAQDAFVICCVARFARWKGQRLAVEALAEFVRKEPRALLLLVGDSGFDGEGYRQEVRALARELGVAEHVRETGFRDDAWRLMAASDLVLHTSLLPEPLGLTPMEAQAVGVPVVAAAAGGVVETVVAGVTAYLFEPGSAADLGRGLEWAAGCDRRQVARSGREQAHSVFDMRQVVERYNRVYEEL